MQYLSIEADFLKKYPARRLLANTLIELLSDNVQLAYMLFEPVGNDDYHHHTYIVSKDSDSIETYNISSSPKKALYSSHELGMLVSSIARSTYNLNCSEFLLKMRTRVAFVVPIGTKDTVLRFSISHDPTQHITDNDHILSFMKLGLATGEILKPTTYINARKVFKRELMRSLLAG